MNLLKEVIDRLLSGQKLDECYQGHALVGNYTGFRECTFRQIGF